MSDASPAAESGNGAALARRVPEPVALAPIMSDEEIARTWRIAKALAASGIYKDVRQAEAAFGKILVGRDLGLSPAQAMSGLHFVEGNVQIHYRMLGAFVRRNGYDFRVREHTNEVCDLEFFDRDGSSLGHSRFSMADAKLAGLDQPRGGKPSNFVKYPRNMLIARAMSNGVGWYCPEVLSGIPVYVEGEIEPAAQISDGQGDGQAQGLDLGPEVEAVLKRAADLSHAALSDRASVEMALADQPGEFVAEWVRKSNLELDELAKSAEPPDAEVVPDPESISGQLGQMRDTAARLLEEAQAQAAAGDSEQAHSFEEQASAISDAADALQGEMDAAQD